MIISSILGMILVLRIPISYISAAPKNPNFNTSDLCKNSPSILTATCCWYEDNPTGGKNKVCQTCNIDLETGDYVDCYDPICPQCKPMATPPTTEDSVFPKDGKAVDDSKPKSPLADQRILPNEGVLDQTETSDEGNDMNNPDIGSGVLEQPEETSNDGNNENNLDSGVLKRQ
jgi:hypothetical protein